MKANDSTITMQTTLESVLQSDLIQDIYVEAGGKAIKVEKKLAGLTNLGKTFFICEDELVQKHNWAWAQVMQKYGDEICGSSAQLKGQSANRSSGEDDGTGTGTGSAATATGSSFKSGVNESGDMTGNGGLIKCSVNKLMEIPHGDEDMEGFVTEANSKAWSSFQSNWEALKKGMEEKLKDKDFKSKNQSDWNNVQKQVASLNPSGGASDKNNISAWKNIAQTIDKKHDWKKLFKGNLKGMSDAWVDWEKECGVTDSAGGIGDVGSKAKKKATIADSKLAGGQEWNPWQTYRIDIETSFTDDWYKRKFKSGFLNKMIMGIKTVGRMGTPDSAKTSMSGHKYTADEMLPQDKKKLDSLQWKMTNKIAKDYISFLLGWTRKKEKYEGEMKVPPDNKLKKDDGFGKSMADKALGNRGVLGRLKQKLFAGGQSNNVISVAFMLADPNDGWKEVKEDTNKETGDSEDSADGDGKSGDTGTSSSGKGGSSSSLGGSSSGKGSGANGGSGGGKNGSSGSSTPFGLSPDSPMLAPIGAQEAQSNPRDASGNLAARVKRLEDEVGITPPTSESSDPFYEDFMEERMELVKEVCDGKRDVYSLIEHCLLEE